MDDVVKTLALSSCYRMQDGSLTEVLEGAEDERDESTPGAEQIFGEIIDSKFRIDSLIGQGGMGTVYRAHHLTLKKDVALKTFRKAKMSEEAWERFQREAKAIAKVDSRHVVQVFDYGVGLDNKPYYTMELLRGQSLAARLEGRRPMPPVEALPIFVQVCNGLTSAHKHGIVHRDLKPGNIFLQQVDGGREVVKVVDFGIAKLVGDRMDAQRLTSTGMVFGSPLYMSPEQSLGDDVDGRSDVYSFACTLYEALTGRPPFVGANAFATINMHQTKKAPGLSANRPGEPFPGWLEDLMARMLEKDRDKRISSFEEIKDVIEFNTSRPDLPGLPASASLASAAGQKTYDSSSVSAALAGQGNTSSDDLKRRFFATPIMVVAAVLILLSGVAGLAMFLGVKTERANTVSVKNAANAGLHQGDLSEKPEEGLMESFDFSTDVDEFPLTKYMDKGWLKLRNEKFDTAKLRKIVESDQAQLDFLKCSFQQSSDLAMLADSAAVRLKICACNIDDEGAESLSKCHNLIYLKANNNKLTSKGVISLTKLSNLISLDVSNSHADDAALRQIVRALPKLEKLMISECEDISRDALLNLRTTGIHRLVFMSRRLDDDGLAYLALMPNLSELEIATSAVSLDGVRKLCKRCKTLKIVNVARCSKIGKEEIKQLQSEFPLVEIKTTDTSGIDILYDES